MRKHLTKKRVIVLAVVAVGVAIGTTAFAYFTASGSGSGSATVGSATGITLTASTTGAPTPGGATGDVAITVHNGGSGSQYVDKVTVGAITDADTACDTSAFSVSPNPITVAQEIAPGADVVVHTTLSMANTASSQDDCQGDALAIALTSN
ncbi:MAG TPA: hypothetical protein VFA88_13035 [Gaiellaceae bacterium]|nr:hypothetical protein [Gaiellaceae bacterium]